ncbi:hypothetical protein JAAARDRAFT_208396 [Jaapia argillacea MUCL 33604]|uniref:Uncharacterized protein n=1 Tax=Jaapia argillacea MUCL 33604 TaxID=933084 RepID=A0A067PKZ6_9AGAM|nr:hypothetical protein JAAARDRAFT_208396 [Jaapia argillacea MUCL 33604]
MASPHNLISTCGDLLGLQEGETPQWATLDPLSPDGDIYITYDVEDFLSRMTAADQGGHSLLPFMYTDRLQHPTPLVVDLKGDELWYRCAPMDERTAQALRQVLDSNESSSAYDHTPLLPNGDQLIWDPIYEHPHPRAYPGSRFTSPPMLNQSSSQTSQNPFDTSCDL